LHTVLQRSSAFPHGPARNLIAARQAVKDHEQLSDRIALQLSARACR
jgi:hypothetical protein